MRSKIHLAYIVLFSTFLSACFQLFDADTNIVIKKAYNSSKSKQAILFLKGGNATTNESLQVSIKNGDDDLTKTEAGNTFVVDSNHGRLHLDSSSVTFTWINNNKLKINYKKKLRTFSQSTNINGVTVIYNPQ